MGELETLDPEEDLVPESMITLLRCDFMFDEALEKLQSFSLIQRGSGADGSKQLSLHPLVQFCGMARNSKDVQRKAFEDAVCITNHAFPMGNLDQWYVSC